MQRIIDIKEIEKSVEKYEEIIISKNKKEKMIMSIEEYEKKMLEKKIGKKLLKAEKQIEEGKTIKATEVFK